MSTLYESFTETPTHFGYSRGARWDAMTFTPATIHSIVSVQLYMYRTGSPGDLTVSIRATDANGDPTGADLTSGTVDADGFPLYALRDWQEITLTAYTLAKGTKFAIVWRALTGSSGNYVSFGQKRANSTMYANGNLLSSSDSGVTWISYDGTGGYSDDDALFKEYGDIPSEAIGSIWIETTKTHIIDEEGDERAVEGTLV